MSEILQAVSTVGFPIVMCGLLFYQLNHTNEQHKIESEKMVEAINNNTIALTKLTQKGEK